MRGARVAGVLALCCSLVLGGCVSDAPVPAEDETNASEHSGGPWPPGPLWDPSYDSQSAYDDEDSLEQGLIDEAKDDADGPPGTDTADGDGAGSTDATAGDGNEGSDTSSSGSNGSGSETDDTSGDGTSTSDGPSDSGGDDGEDPGDSLVDETDDTVTSATENATEALNATTGGDSTLDTNLSD